MFFRAFSIHKRMKKYKSCKTKMRRLLRSAFMLVQWRLVSRLRMEVSRLRVVTCNARTLELVEKGEHGSETSLYSRGSSIDDGFVINLGQRYRNTVRHSAFYDGIQNGTMDTTSRGILPIHCKSIPKEFAF